MYVKGSDPRGYLEVSALGFPLIGLLDSGATCTVVGSKGWLTLKQAGFQLHPPRRHKYISVANNDSTPITGELFIPFTLADVTRVMKVLYVPKLNTSLVLGVDFWRNFRLTPDFCTNTVKVSPDPLIDKTPSDSPPVLPAVLLLGEGEAEGADTESEEPEPDSILTPLQRSELNTLLEEFKGVLDTGKLGCLKGVSHTIDTGSSPPVKQRYYSVNPRMLSEVHKELDERLAAGIVEPSESPYSSPLLILPKKGGTGWRWVVDFRLLNQQILQPSAHPLPHINPMLWNVGGGAIFSSIDVKDAYLQIPLDEASKKKTAFVVPGRGLFQYTRLPAGLKDAAARWQKEIEAVLGHEENCMVYMDDLLLWSPHNDWEHHKALIRRVLTKLARAGLTIKFPKCHFGRARTLYLGHLIDSTGIRPNPEKVVAVVNFPRPRTVRQVRRFLGLAGWVRKFVPDFNRTAKPLYELIKKNVKFSWGEPEELAFNTLKERLCSDPVLKAPDFGLPFKICSDASSNGTGAILSQEFPDGEHVVAYSSRALKGRESKFSATELECLGVLHALEAFRPYVEGYRFEVITDHSSLQWLVKLKNPSGRLARWAVQLQAWDFKISHRKGALMQGPDALSRSHEDDQPTEFQDSACLIDLPEEIQDTWYLSLMEKIERDPDAYEQFKIQDGKIFKLINVGAFLPLCWVQVAPKEARNALLEECHDDPKSAHCGVHRTFHRLRLKAYWPGMQRDVLDYVKKCDVCQRAKVRRLAPAGFMQSKTTIAKPFEVLSTDLISKLPRSSKGNTVLSVTTDLFSKYVFLKPLKGETTTPIAKHVYEDIFLVHGAPRVLVADNAKQYQSKQFRKLCEDWRVQLNYSIKYNPRSNPTERTNGTLRDMIRAYAFNNQKAWDVFIPEFQHALRTAISTATGYSPFQLVYGESFIADGREHLFKGGDTPLEVERPRPDSEAQRRIEFMRSAAQEHLRLNKDKATNRFNLRRRPHQFKVGDVVLRKNFKKSDKAKGYAKKVGPTLVGPFIIKKVEAAAGFLLEAPDGTEDGPWHADQLQPYFA